MSGFVRRKLLKRGSEPRMRIGYSENGRFRLRLRRPVDHLSDDASFEAA